MSFQSKNPASILYENRILFLFGEIDRQMSSEVIPMIMVMDSLGEAPIKMYINSPGGQVSEGMAIYDAMGLVRAPVYTICIGQAASMAAWLLAAGQKGHRLASENSRIMIHQGRTMMSGSYSEMKTRMDEFTNVERSMAGILSRHTNKSVKEIARVIRRDCWMSPEEAIRFGIIDRVVAPVGRDSPVSPQAAR